MNVYLIQTLLFFAVNFMFLLSRSVLWDGKLWYQLMFNRDFNGLMWMTFQAKLPIVFHLYAFLADTFDPTFISKCISFFSLMFAGLIFRWFLEKDQLGSPRSRFLAGFWYCLMPCYLVSIEFCHTMYNMAVLGFFLAAFIHSSTMKDHKKNTLFVPLHILVFILFYFVFSANKAFLFLYPLFIVQSLYQFHQSEPSTKIVTALKNWTKRYWILLLLPFIYWSLKDLPLGIYDNYNAVNLKDFRRFIEAFKVGLKSGNIQILSTILSWVVKDGALLLISAAWFIFLYLFSRKNVSTTRVKDTDRFLIIGLIGSVALMYMIIFPYAAVGKHAQFMDFESRHALLFVFPQALFILFSTSLLEKKFKFYSMLYPAILLFMSLVAAATLENQRRNDVDWYKRQAMVENFKQSESVKNASTIVLHDEILSWDWLRRGVEFYELNGFAQDAFGDQKRLVYDSRFLPDQKFINTPGVPQRYQFKDYNKNGSKLDLRITQGELNLLKWSDYLHLKWLDLTNHKEFEKEIAKALKLQIL